MLTVTWTCWTDLYTETWCVARHLKTSTIAAYRDTLEQFRAWIIKQYEIIEPYLIETRHVLQYVVHLREERKNGDSAISRAVVVIRNFYRAMIAFGHLLPRDDPMSNFPKLKKSYEKLPTFLSRDEVERLMKQPKTKTVLGLRDRAILMLLYATGIRANECASVPEQWVDLEEGRIRVLGKGGREREIALNDRVVESLRAYRRARGPIAPSERFFRSKRGGGINRKIVYQRVKKYSRTAKIVKRVSPHTLRHTCATHLVQTDVNIVTIRDLLGHRMITSTQVYLHVTAHELREVAENHPVGKLAPHIAEIIEGVRIPIDHPPRRREGVATKQSSALQRGARSDPTGPPDVA